MKRLIKRAGGKIVKGIKWQRERGRKGMWQWSQKKGEKVKIGEGCEVRRRWKRTGDVSEKKRLCTKVEEHLRVMQ